MRTLDEILTAIRADFVNNITLQEHYGLDASKTFNEQFSKVSIEAIFTYIVASAIFLYEKIVYGISADLTAKIASEYPFSISWYHDKALAFQLGDALVFNENTYRFDYLQHDTSKQIVRYAAIRQRQIEGVTKLQVFATKAEKTALSVDELRAFSKYMTEIGAAGTHFEFISLSPDLLEVNATVYYNPQLLKSTGESLSGNEKNVEMSIRDYLNGIKYGGVFSRTKLTDAIQGTIGVNDVVLGDVKLNGDLNNAREFESDSGFFKAETINITYTPA